MYAHRGSIIQMISVQIAPDLGSQWAIERADECALQGKSQFRHTVFDIFQPFACLNVSGYALTFSQERSSNELMNNLAFHLCGRSKAMEAYPVYRRCSHDQVLQEKAT